MGLLYAPRADLFEHYVIAVPLPAQYTLSGLLKVPNLLQSKKHLTYGEWVSVGGSTLGISEAVAGAIFELYCSYTMARDERMAHGRDELAWKQSGQRSAWLRSRKVPVHQFLLFAFCQQHKAGGASGTAWQAQPSAVDLIRARQAEHEKVVKFISQHLYHLLALVAPKYKVNFEQIQALGILLVELKESASPAELARMDLNGVSPFAELMHFWAQDRTEAVDIHTVSQYITEHLVLPSRMGWSPLDLTAQRPSNTQTSNGDVIWPAPGASPCRDAIVRGVVRAMVYKISPQHGKAENVQIYDCHHANLYILGGFKNVTILGVSNSTVILGPVSGCVTVVGCSKVNIVVPARGITLQNVSESRVYCCVNTQPLVYNGVDKVELAPYNTFYPALEQHLAEQAVNPLNNLWNSPVSLQHAQSVRLLPVEHFASVWPFKNGG